MFCPYMVADVMPYVWQMLLPYLSKVADVNAPYFHGKPYFTIFGGRCFNFHLVADGMAT